MIGLAVTSVLGMFSLDWSHDMESKPMFVTPTTKPIAVAEECVVKEFLHMGFPPSITDYEGKRLLLFPTFLRGRPAYRVELAPTDTGTNIELYGYRGNQAWQKHLEACAGSGGT
jgi:hypothetical protein